MENRLFSIGDLVRHKASRQIAVVCSLYYKEDYEGGPIDEIHMASLRDDVSEDGQINIYDLSLGFGDLIKMVSGEILEYAYKY